MIDDVIINLLLYFIYQKARKERMGMEKRLKEILTEGW